MVDESGNSVFERAAREVKKKFLLYFVLARVATTVDVYYMYGIVKAALTRISHHTVKIFILC
jgi:hypothetical protein